MNAITAIALVASLTTCLLPQGTAFGADPVLDGVKRPAQPDHAPVLIPPPKTPDPLVGSLAISPNAMSRHILRDVGTMLPSRSDSPADWYAGVEPLHDCGEPRLLPPCVPPPPCHPSMPPQPFDLIDVPEMPTSGQRYRGPCCPRTGTHYDSPLPRIHRMHDRAFDWFYLTK